jgi:hypothetical protein
VVALPARPQSSDPGADVMRVVAAHVIGANRAVRTMVGPLRGCPPRMELQSEELREVYCSSDPAKQAGSDSMAAAAAQFARVPATADVASALRDMLGPRPPAESLRVAARFCAGEPFRIMALRFSQIREIRRGEVWKVLVEIRLVAPRLSCTGSHMWSELTITREAGRPPTIASSVILYHAG